MKNNTVRYFSLSIFFVVLIACSTKKDKFINRQFQALNTKYNVLYNGNLALDKGIEELKLKYEDNFWEILPIERMQISKENILPGQTKNPNFDRAEEKATKAIQKRSMNIDGKEKNPQMDEAHLLLGKARYYDQRFVPALEAFNYILYKYPESDKIYEAKIWRERTNMRMENDALAVKNLRKLLSEIKFKDQIFADANATLAQAFLNIAENDSAIVRLKLATEFTKSDEEKARYRFILGQLYEQSGKKDSAFVAFQSIIDMKRKSPRRYVIQAHAKQAQQFDFEKGDTIAFLKKYDDLLEDRENRPFLDVLNHQMALFYGKQNKKPQAIKYYNRSLRAKSQDKYLMASNYRNLADIYFDTAKYQTAGNYYDSTLVRLEPRTREYNYIKKKRENLDDVIKYEDIAQKNDSILNVVALSESDKKSFYEDYIVKLKKSDLEKAEKEKALEKKLARQSDASGDDDIEPIDRKGAMTSKGISNPSENKRAVDGKMADPIGKKGITPPSSTTTSSSSAKNDANTFYFYNPATIAYGKVEFKKKWGSRIYKNNWRLSAKAKDNEEDQEENETEKGDSIVKKVDEKALEPKYTTDFYLKQLPTSQKVIDSLGKERNFAYYQLGVIYKEKFKEYKLAASKLEQLLRNRPEERLVLPAMYNLYKIYEIIDPAKAVAMKGNIISQFPTSRYAQILSNSATGNDAQNQSPEVVYENLFNKYEDQKYFEVLASLENTITQFTGDEIVPKMELLKANTIGKLKGLNEYKTALNFVALNYPSSEEGKQAEAILSKDVPKMEALQFDAEEALSWKILYKVSNVETPQTKVLQDKIKKFVAERTSQRLTSSIDIYNMTESFIVVHNIGSEQTAKDIVSIFTDYKDYKFTQTAIVISNENYKIVQMKKNLDVYLSPRVAPAKSVVEPSQTSVKETPTQQKPPTEQKSPMPNNRKEKSQPETKPDPEKRNNKVQKDENPSPKMVDPSATDDPLEPNTPPTPKKKP